MKKLYLLLMIVSLIFAYGCGKSNNEEVKQNDNKQISQEENKKDEKEEKKEEDKKDQDKIEKNEEQKPKEDEKQGEIKEINLMYFDENTTIVFDNALTNEEVKQYINKELKEKPELNSSYLVKFQDGKILSFERKDKIKVTGKYIGLSDANVAEFSYNSNAFRLEITQEQSEKLEEISENQLLSLEVEKSQNDGANFKLVDFSTK